MHEKIWIGDSTDAQSTNLGKYEIKSLFNVAQDLQGKRGWADGVEYAQVGLIDGPGNPVSLYCSAVLCLAGLLTRGNTMVYDHDGGRALAVVMFYFNLTIKRERDLKHTFMTYRWSWSELLSKVRNGTDLIPNVHTAHVEAFEKIPWGVLDILI